MRIESTSFTRQDLDRFGDDLIESDRLELADRLERDSEHLAAVAGRLPDSGAAGSGEGWSPREILAHIAVLSKFYGMLTYKIGRGELSELDLLANVGQRDVLGEQLARLPAAELVAMARADHGRTVGYLRAVDAAALKRECHIGEGRTMTAGEIARLALCAHLEQHLRQLEGALPPA